MGEQGRRGQKKPAAGSPDGCGPRWPLIHPTPVTPPLVSASVKLRFILSAIIYNLPLNLNILFHFFALAIPTHPLRMVFLGGVPVTLPLCSPGTLFELVYSMIVLFPALDCEPTEVRHEVDIHLFIRNH